MALSRLLVSMLLSSLLVIASATNYDQYPPQGPKSDYSDNDNYNPKLPLLTNELLPTDQIAFQGFISCKLGIKDLPLKGKTQKQKKKLNHRFLNLCYHTSPAQYMSSLIS